MKIGELIVAVLWLTPGISTVLECLTAIRQIRDNTILLSKVVERVNYHQQVIEKFSQAMVESVDSQSYPIHTESKEVEKPN